MKRKINIGIITMLFAIMSIMNVMPVQAAEMAGESEVVLSTEDMDDNSTIKQTVTNNEGEECTIEITEIPTKERAGSQTWKVS